MYKVIYNDIVIDLLQRVRYGKYIPATKRVVAVDKSAANCIVASNFKDRYLLRGVPVPEGCSYKQVSLVPISNEEYYLLLGESDDPYQDGIRRIKQHKISELREICNKNILNGVQVQLSDGLFHHFEMSIEDQLNLNEIRYLMDEEEVFIYHESGGEYTEFSKQDMKKIIDAAFKHKQHQLKHFNSLKKYINQLNNIDEISKITYNFEVKSD